MTAAQGPARDVTGHKVAQSFSRSRPKIMALVTARNQAREKMRPQVPTHKLTRDIPTKKSPGAASGSPGGTRDPHARQMHAVVTKLMEVSRLR